MIGVLVRVTKRIGTRTRGLGNKRTTGDQLMYSITDIGYNTEKSPGDLKRFAVTQTPMRNLSANVGRKSLKRE